MTDSQVPLPPVEWRNEKPWEGDSMAEAEVKNFADSKALQGQKDENTLRLLRNSGWIAVILMYFFMLVFMSSMVVWLVHYLSPWSWLSEVQLSKIQTVIFSGSIGALVSAFAQKHINS
jgi:hypothetical protein